MPNRVRLESLTHLGLRTYFMYEYRTRPNLPHRSFVTSRRANAITAVSGVPARAAVILSRARHERSYRISGRFTHIVVGVSERVA
jgi:hypothetical protein